jgi:hypothetical protein
MAKQTAIKISIKDLCALVRVELKKTELPKELRLDVCSLITDVTKFFDSHLCIVEGGEGKFVAPYKDRLSQALVLIGIDTKNLLQGMLRTRKPKKSM